MRSVYDKLVSLDACGMGVPVVLDLTGGDGYTIVPFEAICKRDPNIGDKFKSMELHDNPTPPDETLPGEAEGSLDVLCYSGTHADDQDRDGCQGCGLLFKKAKFLDTVENPSDAILIDLNDLHDKSGKRNVFISSGTCVMWPDSLHDLARPKAFLFAFHCGMFVQPDIFERNDVREMELFLVSAPALLRVQDLYKTVDKQMVFYDGIVFKAIIGQAATLQVPLPVLQPEPKPVLQPEPKPVPQPDPKPVPQPVPQPVTETPATRESKDDGILKWYTGRSEKVKNKMKVKLREFNERWDKIGTKYTYTANVFHADEEWDYPVCYQYEFERFDLVNYKDISHEVFNNLFSNAKAVGNLSATTDSDSDGELKLALFMFFSAHLKKKNFDIFELEECSSIWWHIPSIRKRYIIDGRHFEIPKLKLGFETNGSPSKNDSCFPTVYDIFRNYNPSLSHNSREPTALWIEQCTELEEFCKIVDVLTTTHGVITSIPAIILCDKKHELLVKFNNGHLRSIPTTQLEREFLFQLSSVQLTKTFGDENAKEAKLLGDNGYETVKDMLTTEGKKVMLTFTTEEGNERTCQVEKKYADKFLRFQHVSKVSSRAARDPAPYATGDKKRGGGEYKEGPGGEKRKQRRVAQAPYATYDDEAAFDRQ